MGRFHLLHDDEPDDNDTNTNQDKHWKFLSEPGEEGDIVLYDGDNNHHNNHHQTSSGRSNGSVHQQSTIGIDPQTSIHSAYGWMRPKQNSKNEWEILFHYDTDREGFQQPTTGNNNNNDNDNTTTTATTTTMMMNSIPTTTRNNRWIWIVSCLILMVAYYWRDLPPIPPQNDKDAYDNRIIDWNEYLLKHSQQLTNSFFALGVQTPWHVLSWLGLNLYMDLQIWWQKIQESRQVECTYPNWSDLPNSLQQRMVGQTLAMERVMESILAWHNEDEPLVLWAVGYPHTGKRTLVLEHIASHIKKGCASTNNLVLQLQGSEWNMEEYQKYEDTASIELRAQTMFQNLSSLLIAHAERRHGLAVILFYNVEEMEPMIFRKLVNAFIPMDASIDTNDHNLIQLRSKLCNTIIYITTSAGKMLEPITRNLRASNGGDWHNSIGLTNDLQAAFQEIWGISYNVATMLPFGPLMVQHLSEILRQRIHLYSQNQSGKLWKELHITDAAVAAMLDPKRVEYLEWRRHDNSLVMTVSLEGASILDDRGPLLTKIKAQIQQMIQQDGRKIDQVAVLDLEQTNLLVSDNQGLLKWCDSDIPTKCRKVLTFRI